MNRLARLLKVFTRLVVIYDIVLVVMMGWPTTGFLGLLVGLSMIGRRGVKYLTTLGSARFASKSEIRRAGMLGGKSGLILGRIEKKGELVRLVSSVPHTVVMAPTGTGKTTGLAIPFLLTCKDNCIVLDIKNGELAAATADARERMGHEVVILDPYKVVTE